MDPLLYVVGTPYTGSTLLSFLLNAHPEIVAVGEATGPAGDPPGGAGVVCSCGSLLRNCPFWASVAVEMQKRGQTFDVGDWNTEFRLRVGPLLRQALVRSLRSNALDGARDALVQRLPVWGPRLRELARRNESFAASVLAVSGKRILADASKDPIRPRFLAALTGLAPRAIHLIRDSPGFVSSYMRNAGGTLSSGVRLWTRVANAAERLRAILPAERWLCVRYEDLCAAPQQELARIWALAGVAALTGPISFRSCEHHILGNRMRLSSSSEIALDESWRERLNPAQLVEILQRTNATRARYGYTDTRKAAG
jgi:hypothetical protein